MEGLNEHLKEKAEWEAQLAGSRNGMGGGGGVSSSQDQAPPSGDILGFAGVGLDSE